MGLRDVLRDRDETTANAASSTMVEWTAMHDRMSTLQEQLASSRAALATCHTLVLAAATRLDSSAEGRDAAQVANAIVRGNCQCR